MQTFVLTTCMALLASQIAAQAVSAEERDSASVARFELLEQGASTGRTDYNYLGPKPKLPIRDKTGRILPSSCNPHINLCSAKFDKTKIESLTKHLKELRPDSDASHVAVYLNSDVLKDAEFITQLRKQLPKCQIYRESDDIFQTFFSATAK